MVVRRMLYACVILQDVNKEIVSIIFHNAQELTVLFPQFGTKISESMFPGLVFFACFSNLRSNMHDLGKQM